MQLVEKHIIKRTDRRYKELMNLCHLSKNLYNTVLYTIRQHWFETEKDDIVKHKFLNYLKCNSDAVMPADVGFVYNPVKVYL